MKSSHLTLRAVGLCATLALPVSACSSKDDPKPVNVEGTGGINGTGGNKGTGGGGGSPSGTGGAIGTGGTTTVDGGGDAPSPSDTSADAAPSAVEQITCTGESDRNKAITPAAGRKVHCAIDLGSNNLKLQIISMEEGKPLSFKDERQCRVRLGFGAKVYDEKTATKSPLAPAQIADLTSVITEYQRICALDTGNLVGAEATQWARDATNMTDVKAMVKAATGIEIDVLTPQAEGQYGYTAATRNMPEKFSLDPGSNSFQIGWLANGTTEIRTASVPFGYVRAGTKYYGEMATDSYEVARGKHATEAKTLLDEALGKLTPPTSLAMLKAAITAGNLKPELFLVGQDGALHLAVKAALRPEGKWIDDKKVYDTRVAMEKPTNDPAFGDITTKLTPAEFATFFADIVKEPDYTALRSAKVRGLYGEKILANAVLLDLLIKELGITTVVLVPQEMPAGYILAKVK